MLGGNIISAISMWLITLYLVRVNALDDLGILSLVQSLGLMFFVFCTFKLTNVQITDKDKIFSEADYYFARMFSASLCILMIVLFLLLSSYDFLIKICCLIYSFYYGLMILKEYFFAEYQVYKNYKKIFIYNSISGLSSCLSFIFLYFFTEQIIISLIGMLLANFFCMVVNHFVFENIKSLYLNFNAVKSLQLIRNNFFLGLSALFVSGLILIPRFFIESNHGLESLGIFSALTSIMFFINIFLNSLTQVFLKETIDVYDVDKIKSYQGIVLNFFIISVVIIIGLISIYFLRDFATIIIFGNGFLKYSNEFFYAITLSGFLFWFNYGNFLLNVQRNFGVQIYISIATFFIQMILCFFLVNQYSYVGAFVAMGSTYILGFLLCVLAFLWKEKNAR